MKKILIMMVTGAMVCAFSASAWAQNAKKTDTTTTTAPTQDGVSYTKNTEYDFEDDLVEGSFVRPEGEYFNSQKRGRYSSLIKVRRDFVPEMLKSAEDI